MKTTVELPDPLMGRVKLGAVCRNQKLKDTIAQLHTQTLEIAAQFGISAYDARFIGLAKQ